MSKGNTDRVAIDRHDERGKAVTIGWASICSVDGASVNIARVAVHAFGFSNDKKTVPVHVSRLSAFFRRYYPTISISGPLDLLCLLKEIIRLPDGFWVPAAARSVSIGTSESLLIAPHPTTELERGLGNRVEKLEFGRMCPSDQSASLEAVSLESWSQPIASPLMWLEEFTSSKKLRLQDTVASGRDIRICQTWKSGTKSGAGSSWLPYAAGTAVPNGLHLCSEMAQGRPIRKFVGEFRDGVLRKECDIATQQEALLFRFALELQRERRLVIRPYKVAEGYSMHISRTLPESEMMLLTASATTIREVEYGYLLTFKKSLYPVIRSSLERAGMSIQEHQ